MKEGRGYDMLLFCITVVCIVLIRIVSKSKTELNSVQEELNKTTELLKRVSDVDKYCQDKEAERTSIASEIAELEKKRLAEVRKLEQERISSEQERKALQKELNRLTSDILASAVKIDEYQGMKSDEIKNQLSLLTNRQDELVKKGNALLVQAGNVTSKILNAQKNKSCVASMRNVLGYLNM